jgi:tRNA(Ile)-lysidine synthase
MRDEVVRAIESSVQQLLSRRPRLVLAVSGGADSAVLLDAVVKLRTTTHQIVVASVDHGTGDAATEATALTVAAAARAGLPAISERLTLIQRDEASLRDGRWKFLRRVAAVHGGAVVTAHSLDDHVETVVMRVLRGSSARGLAGLLAESGIERPLLEHRRAAVREYAKSHRVEFVEDPTNSSLAYFRNRVRLQLLPAIRAVRPEFEQQMIDISRRAATLRSEVDVIAREFTLDVGDDVDALVRLDADALNDLPDDSLWLVLPALAARSAGGGGATLDRRGVARLASVVRSAAGSRGQLAGGYEAIRGRHDVTISRPSLIDRAVLRLREKGETKFGRFRFLAEPGTSIVEDAPNAWRIYIPRSAEPVVRQWHPGDRLTTDLKGSRRKVKRFFADAGVVGPLRAGWPVVICGEDVVWIPGIKASQAAVRREGKMVHYTCERIRD